MPKPLQLVEKVDEVDANLRKIDHASMSQNSSGLTSLPGAGGASGSRATTAQMQAVLERLDKLAEKNTEMDQKVKDAVAKADTAQRHSEATDLENESLRKDIARLEGKLKEVGRKAALPPPENSRLDEKIEGIQSQVQSASGKTQELADRLEALQMQVGQASSKADAAAEKADSVRAATNASTLRDTYWTRQDRAVQALEAKFDRIASQVQDVEGEAQSASSKADTAFSRADAASNKAAKAHTLACTTSVKQDTQGSKLEETMEQLYVKCGSVSDGIKDLRSKMDAASAKAENASSTSETAATKAETALKRATSASIPADEADALAKAVISTQETQTAQQEVAVKSLEEKCIEFADNIKDLQDHEQSNADILTFLQSQIKVSQGDIASLENSYNASKQDNGYGVLVSNLPTDITQTLIVDYFQESSGPIISSQMLLKDDGDRTAVVAHFRHKRSVSGALKWNGTKIDGQNMRVEALTKSHNPQEVFAQRA